MYSKEELWDLCNRAVDAKQVYSCGESPKWDTVDPTTGTTQPIQQKPWEVKTAAGEDSDYFTGKELGDYLTKLLAEKS